LDLKFSAYQGISLGGHNPTMLGSLPFTTKIAGIIFCIGAAIYALSQMPESIW
jgi:hypothetical protein